MLLSKPTNTATSQRQRFPARAAPPALLLLFLLSVAGIGCDSTALDPIVESKESYSIFGYVDARADTQFVRVEALRDSMRFGTSALDPVDVRPPTSAPGAPCRSAIRCSCTPADSAAQLLRDRRRHVHRATSDLPPLGERPARAGGAEPGGDGPASLPQTDRGDQTDVS